MLATQTCFQLVLKTTKNKFKSREYYLLAFRLVYEILNFVAFVTIELMSVIVTISIVLVGIICVPHGAVYYVFHSRHCTAAGTSPLLSFMFIRRSTLGIIPP